jgi:hypothetical protein
VRLNQAVPTSCDFTGHHWAKAGAVPSPWRVLQTQLRLGLSRRVPINQFLKQFQTPQAKSTLTFASLIVNARVRGGNTTLSTLLDDAPISMASQLFLCPR